MIYTLYVYYLMTFYLMLGCFNYLLAYFIRIIQLYVRILQCMSYVVYNSLQIQEIAAMQTSGLFNKTRSVCDLKSAPVLLSIQRNYTCTLLGEKPSYSYNYNEQHLRHP